MKDNLIKNFGSNAVKNTSHNFAEHFQTVYTNHTGNVYSLSDVHGDIHSLIISLRDCARVISKPNFVVGQSNLDPMIEMNLNMDISIDESYDEQCDGSLLDCVNEVRTQTI
jgi:hypothetical protein